MLCNALVCLAVWLALAGHSVTDKILAIVFPVSAFVAAGFEHSIANMYFIPLGMLLKSDGVVPATIDAPTLNWQGFAANLLPVTLGNIVGGSVMVALVYYVIYRQREKISARRRVSRSPLLRSNHRLRGADSRSAAPAA